MLARSNIVRCYISTVASWTTQKRMLRLTGEISAEHLLRSLSTD